MATTVGTTTRMVPLGLSSSEMASEPDHVVIHGTVAVGDVLLLSTAATGANGGPIVEDNSDPVVAIGGVPTAQTGILGVALKAGVAADVIEYAPAYPGRQFEANLINEATDLAAPTDNTLLLKMYGIVESADGFACINQNSAAAAKAEVTFVKGWGRQTRGTGPAGRYLVAKGLPTNPRVIFVFNSSVWALSA